MNEEMKDLMMNYIYEDVCWEVDYEDHTIYIS